MNAVMIAKGGWNLEYSYRTLPSIFFTSQSPEKAPSPSLVCLNRPLAQFLGLKTEGEEVGLTDIFSGRALPPGAQPLAQAYAGHQFGHLSILGDGRALLLGEQITPDGKRLDIHLKGSGPTPYSRRGDGKATLGPMLREYLMSEGMHALGVSTCRSLAVVQTGEWIQRETLMPGAVLARVAQSHLRIGTFEYAAVKGSKEAIKALADYAIWRHAPDAAEDPQPYQRLFLHVLESQAKTLVQWQTLGFVHGVMNTDNMTISGETIDYGPCAFMEKYDPATVFSSIDHFGRYAFGRQPEMALWNLSRWGESFWSLLGSNSQEAETFLQEALESFVTDYKRLWLDEMGKKLGFSDMSNEADVNLVLSFLDMMKKNEADFTNSFLSVTYEKIMDQSLARDPAFEIWIKQWRQRVDKLEGGREKAYERMFRHNPAVIPRNQRVEAVLEAAVQGDLQPFEMLLSILQQPFFHEGLPDGYQVPSSFDGPYQTFCGT